MEKFTNEQLEAKVTEFARREWRDYHFDGPSALSYSYRVLLRKLALDGLIDFREPEAF